MLKVNVTGLHTNDIYVSVGSDNAIDQLDPLTGALTPVITGLNSPHGMIFMPSSNLTSDTMSLFGTATMTSADFPVSGQSATTSGSGGASAWDQVPPASTMMATTQPTSSTILPLTTHI